MFRAPTPVEAEALAAHQVWVTEAAAETSCLGAFELERDGRRRWYLLGAKSVLTHEPKILDWKTAPLAGLYFAAQVGEPLELEVGGRPFVGRLVSRARYRVVDGALVEVWTEGWRAERRKDGWWIAPPSPEGWRWRPSAARAQASSAWITALDPAQRAAVERPSDRSLLLLGEAGFGKTTVALHRLAHLAEEAGRDRRRFRGLVVVPSEGLVRLARRTLDRLGVPGVEVETYDHLAEREAKLAFPDLPERIDPEKSVPVLRLKRHPELKRLLAERARSLGPPKRRTLLKLFGDRGVVERVAEAAGLGPGSVAEVLEHTHQQFERSSEAALGHVRRSRRQAVDGRGLDEGTPAESAETFDPEDAAVLFELAYRRGEHPLNLGRYDHLVLDEAQELAPLELAWLGRLIGAEGAMTIAGDAQQQTDDTAYFPGWPEALANLGVPEAEVVHLLTSYRCPEAVTTLARAVLAGAPLEAPGDPEAAARLVVVPTRFHQAALLIDGLTALVKEDPRATVAVIGRHASAARQLAEELGRGIGLRLVLDGNFDFAPGVVVTTMAEAKGLEFDYVVLPDQGPGVDPPTPEGRRALYVALTRASQQVWIVRIGG